MVAVGEKNSFLRATQAVGAMVGTGLEWICVCVCVCVTDTAW